MDERGDDVVERPAVALGARGGLQAVLKTVDRVAGRAARLQGPHRVKHPDVQATRVLSLARVDEGELFGGAVLHPGKPGPRHFTQRVIPPHGPLDHHKWYAGR